MIADILAVVTGFVTHVISQFGYAGVSLLMTIQSAAIPLPSEVIMPFAGFLVESGRFTLLGLALAGATGSLVGSLLTYALGYYGGRPLVLKYGRFVLISEHDLELTEKFFRKFGSISVLIGKMTPIISTFISIPAGMGRIGLRRFIIFCLAGSFVWSFFLAWIGSKLGENWPSLEIYFHKFDLAIGLILLAMLIYWVRRHIKHRIR